MTNFAFCLQIGPESYKWGSSVRSVDLGRICKPDPKQKMATREVCILCSILNVLLFLEVNFIQIKASVMFFGCCFYITIV